MRLNPSSDASLCLPGAGWKQGQRGTRWRAGDSVTRGGRFALCAALWALVSAGTAGAGATFTTFDVPGSVSTWGESINSANTIAGQYEANTAIHGFMRTADGTLTTFDPPESFETFSVSINEGNVIAGDYLHDFQHGFVRAADGTITTFDPPGSGNTYVESMNEKGAVAGFYFNYNGTVVQGFVRGAGGAITTIDVPGANGTLAYAIDDKRVIAGLYFDGKDVQHGFVRTADGTITTFDVPGSSGTLAYAINDTGTITGNYLDSNGYQNGFLRTSDGSITTFDYRTCDIRPVGINASGTIVAMCRRHRRTSGLVRESNGAIRGFHVPDGITNTFPAGINDQGAIAGFFGIKDSVVAHAFLRTP